MAKTQTLMLYFDVSHVPGRDHGDFADDVPFQRSRIWLDDGGTSQRDSLPVTVALGDQVDFAIRVDSNVPAGLTVSNLRVTVALWRSHGAVNDAKYDSPFVDGTGKQRMIFDSNFIAGAGTVHLGVAKLNSVTPGNHDRYIFLVTAMLDAVDCHGTVCTYTAAHDPQMVVDM